MKVKTPLRFFIYTIFDALINYILFLLFHNTMNLFYIRLDYVSNLLMSIIDWFEKGTKKEEEK